MKDLDVKKIQPTKGYVLVEPAKVEEKTKSGIILSESDSEKPQYGVVLAVGESGCCCDEDCCESEGCCSDEEGCCGGSCDCESDEKETDKNSKKSKASEKSEEKEEDFECCGGHCHDCEEDSEKGCCSDEEGCCSDKSGCCCDGAYLDCECDCDCEASPVKVGDKVIYKKWGGNEFKIGDLEYQFLKFEDILAVIND